MKTQRIRITFGKTEAMRFTGHLDTRRVWVRTFRRAKLPLTYSSGYTPRPQFNLAAPLPLGFLSNHELGDFWLEERYHLEDINKSLSSAVPPGISLLDIREIDDLHSDKLPTLVESAEYEVSLLTPLPSLSTLIMDFQAKDHAFRERKGNKYDLQPLVHDLKIVAGDEKEQQRLWMKLALLPGATGRPDEVIAELGGNPHKCMITRTKIHLNK